MEPEFGMGMGMGPKAILHAQTSARTQQRYIRRRYIRRVVGVGFELYSLIQENGGRQILAIQSYINRNGPSYTRGGGRNDDL